MCELKLTNVNTIVSSDGNFKELIVDDFFDILNKKHGRDYAVYYEADENKFIVIFKGVEYYLTLDKITMENYFIGKDNKFTSKLRSIVNKTEKMEKRIADEEEQEALMAIEREKKVAEMARRRKIIRDAEEGIIPNDEAKKIYLDYLLEEKRLSNRIKKYFKNLGSDFRSSLRAIQNKFYGATHGNSNITQFIIILIIILFSVLGIISIGKCIWVMGSDVLKFFYNLLTNFTFDFVSSFDMSIFSLLKYSLLPLGIYPIVLGVSVISTIKKRICRLLHYGENKRLRNYKIKELTDSLALGNVSDKAIDFFDATLNPEEKVENSIPIDDYVMGYLGDIVVRLKYINTADSEKLLSEVEELATEYKQRLEKFRTKELNESHSEINLEIDPETERSLKIDILVKASRICDKMLQIRGHDVEKMKLDDDYSTLMSMINEPAENIVGGERSRCRKLTDNINKIND